MKTALGKGMWVLMGLIFPDNEKLGAKGVEHQKILHPRVQYVGYYRLHVFGSQADGISLYRRSHEFYLIQM